MASMVNDIREKSTFIFFLYMEIQLPQYHLLKRPSIFMTIVLVIEFFLGGVSFGFKYVS